MQVFLADVSKGVTNIIVKLEEENYVFLTLSNEKKNGICENNLL